MMQDKDYLSVKDVAEKLDTEAYVLRYYEKELNLDIKRNGKGHRVYTLEDLEMFRKIQDMREKGLQLKAIESIVHGDPAGDQARETYEQLTSIAAADEHAVATVDITDPEDEKVRVFSGIVKHAMKESLSEFKEETTLKMQEMIQQEVEMAVEEQVSRLEERQEAKNAAYYQKLDEAMREVQRMRRELYESVEEQPKKEKPSFWGRLFKSKNQTTEI